MGMERAIEKLAPLAIAFVFVGIAIAIGAVVIGEIADMDVVNDGEEDSVAYDVVNSALDALATLGSFLTVLAVVAVASLIFLLLKVFGRTANSGNMM